MWLLPVLLSLLFSLLFLSSRPALAQSDCVDLICRAEQGRLGLLETAGHHEELLDSDGKVLEKCRNCTDCISSGYSVCVQSRHFDTNRRRLTTEPGSCECAHSGPSVEHLGQRGQCRLVPGDGGRPGLARAEPQVKAGEAIFRLCYASALRKLPIPQATNEHEEGPGTHPVLVTVEQFWLADYWKALRPQTLHLFYVFPVHREDHCDAKALVPSAQELMWVNEAKSRDQIDRSSQMTWLCKAALEIKMSGLLDHEKEEPLPPPPPIINGQQRGLEDEDEYYGDNVDPDLPPEVQFERDVFAGADRVRFYYELEVERENHLKTGAGGKLKFESRRTMIKSDSLDFELHPEIYGTGMNRSRSSSSSSGAHQNGSSRIDRVSIEQHHRPAANEQKPREPIVRPVSSGGKLGRVRSGEARSASSTSHGSAMPSSPGTRPIQSRPAASSAHAIDASTAMPAPAASSSAELESPDDFTDEPVEDGGEHATSSSSSGPVQKTQPSGDGNDPDEQDWLLLRNVMMVFLLLLTVFVLVALCYKRGMCCFAKRTANGSQQQRNGKTAQATRVQNGKEYRQAGNGK